MSCSFAVFLYASIRPSVPYELLRSDIYPHVTEEEEEGKKAGSGDMSGSFLTEKWGEWRALLKTSLHDRNRIWTKVFEALEARIGVDRVNIALVLKLFLAFYLLAGHGREFVCNLIGFLYPAYSSIKAIESKDKADDTKWLTYWVVFAAFSLLEFFSDFLLSWMPFYWLLKCVFLIFCMLPFSWNGSSFIYKRIIRPLFLRHEKQIDKVIDSATEAGEEIVNEATKGRRRKLIDRNDSKGGGEGDEEQKNEKEKEDVPPAADERKRRT